jgi:hypothetical protein
MEVIVVEAAMETTHAAMETTHAAVETTHAAVETTHALSLCWGRKYHRDSGRDQDTAGSKKPSYPTHIRSPIMPQVG